MLRIRNPKDFWAGAVYTLFGLAAVVIGSGYSFGTGTRMGPGYFPTVLGSLLTAFGLLAIGRSFLRDGGPVGAIAWKPLLLVVGSTIAFGLLLNRAGLAIALLALVLVSALASQHFRFGWRASLALAGLIAFCVIVFVKLLGVPLPLVGTWFEM